MLERGDSLLAGDGGEIIQELVKGVTGLQIIQQVLKDHPRAAKDGRPPRISGSLGMISLSKHEADLGMT